MRRESLLRLPPSGRCRPPLRLPQSSAWERAALFFDYFYDFAALIFSAARAHPVRQFGFVATGALGEHRAGQRIVGAARRGAALGMTSFWIGHVLLPYF